MRNVELMLSSFNLFILAMPIIDTVIILNGGIISIVLSRYKGPHYSVPAQPTSRALWEGRLTFNCSVLRPTLLLCLSVICSPSMFPIHPCGALNLF